MAFNSLIADSLSLGIDHIHLFDSNLFPYMFCHVDLAGEVFVNFFTVLKLHDKYRTFQITGIIEQSFCTNEVFFQSLHAFQMRGRTFIRLASISAPS